MIGLLWRTVWFPVDFIQHLPPMQSGSYTATASSASPWYEWTRYSKQVCGRRKAYMYARLAALYLDWTVPNPELAIRWSVKRN
jgi:hypothetical protein